MNAILQACHGGVFECPLCAWKLAIAPVSNDRSLFPPPEAHRAALQRAELIERQLHDHLAEHAIADWVSALREKDSQIASLTRSNNRLRHKLHAE